MVCGLWSHVKWSLLEELLAEQHFTRYIALSWKDNKVKIRWKEISHLYNYSHRCLPFPKVHANTTDLSFKQDHAAHNSAGYRLLTPLPCSDWMGWSHRSISEGSVWPRDPIFCSWLFCVSGRPIHQSYIWNKEFIQPAQLIAVSNTFREAQIEWGCVFVADTVLHIGSLFYLETRWLFQQLLQKPGSCLGFPAQWWPRWCLYFLYIQLLG